MLKVSNINDKAYCGTPKQIWKRAYHDARVRYNIYFHNGYINENFWKNGVFSETSFDEKIMYALQYKNWAHMKKIHYDAKNKTFSLKY